MAAHPSARAISARICAARNAREPLAGLLAQMERFLVHRETVHNIVPDVGLQALAINLLNDDVPDDQSVQIQYAALGTGGGDLETTNSGSATDTALQAEAFRLPTTDQSAPDGQKKAYNTLYLGVSEGNGQTFTEAGLFAGTADDTADSGLLMSRVKFASAFVKTDDKTLLVRFSHEFLNA